MNIHFTLMKRRRGTGSDLLSLRRGGCDAGEQASGGRSAMTSVHSDV